MAQTDKLFAGSIPENYDRYLVPLIFEGYAEDLARRAVEIAPCNVLETACGTGVVTRAMTRLLPPDIAYTATDLNQPMLDLAAARQDTDDRIIWRQANAQALPFPDGVFDLVCCQFGAMFFLDRVGAYREARRVLTPGGRFVFNVWDRIEENAFADVVIQALQTVFPADPPRFLARTPHGYHDPAQIRADLAAAGFGAITIETIAKESRAPSPRQPAIAYCQGTPMRGEIEARGGVALAEATDIVASKLAERFGTVDVSGKIQAHVMTAVA